MNQPSKILFSEGDNNPHLTFLPCLDSPGMAETCRRELDIPRFKASILGLSAFQTTENSYFLKRNGEKVNWWTGIDCQKIFHDVITYSIIITNLKSHY